MEDNSFCDSPEFIDLIHRMFHLKNKANISALPENLTFFQGLMQGTNLSGKSGAVNDFDLFYNVGIVLLRHETPVTMGELSREMGISLSTSTRVVDWMVNNGFVQRLSDPDDRRVVRVALTDAGRDIHRATTRFLAEHTERLMSKFTPDERATFLKLLRKLINELENENSLS